MRHISKALLLCLPLVLWGCDDDDEATAPPPVTGGGGTQTGARLIGIEDDKLLQFSAGNPGTLQGEITMSGFTGAGTSNPPFVLGADFRPATGVLYVLMSDNLLYTVSTTTGAATLVGPLEVGATQIEAFNFDPVRDRIRAVGANQENFELEPDGSLSSMDDTLAYAAGDAHAADAPTIESVAYTNNNGAATTTAYAIDSTLDTLVTIGNVNGSPEGADSGQLFTVADLSQAIGGAGPPPFAIESVSGGLAYVTDSDGTQTQLFRVNLVTGVLTDLGEVGTDRRISALTVVGGVPGGGGGGGGNPPPGGVGGDAFCTTPIVGTGVDLEVGDPSPQCLDCSFINADNVIDTDLDDFARFDFGVGLLLAGIPVTVTAPTGTVYPRERLAGGVFRLPDTSPTETSVAPDLTITTLLLGEEQETFTLGGDSLMVALLGQGLSEDRFFAGFETTEPFDAIEILPSVGLVGVTMQLEFYSACAGAAEAGTFPP